MKLYVAGPMSGLPENNVPAFYAAQAELELVGYDVFNPGSLDQALPYAELVALGLAELDGCQGVALLPGWTQSRGANGEVEMAKRLGLLCVPVNVWVHLAALA